MTRSAEAQSLFDARTFARLDEYVLRQLEEARIPGAAVAVVQGGRIVHARGYGTAGDKEMTAQTPVLIGSLQKGMTAIAIMQLVEAGRVELDAPVRRYLPTFRVADPVASEMITVRQLLSHTSGLPSSADRPFKKGADSSRQALTNGPRLLADVRLVSKPGTELHYSNPNYVLLGAIVEAVTGQAYEAYMQKNVYVPIGMSSTFTSLPEARAHGLATGFQYAFGRPVAAPPQAQNRRYTPTGYNIASSAEDMGRYLIMLLHRGSTDGRRILSEKGVDELFHPQVAIDTASSRRDKELPLATAGGSYGMGWAVSTIHGHDVVWHTGSMPDATNAYALMARAEDWGLVVLVNAFTSGPGPAREGLAYGIRDVLMQREPAPVPRLGWPRELVILAALLVMQVLAIAHSLGLFMKWNRRPDLRPTSRMKRWGWHTMLPLLGTLSVPILLLFAGPAMQQTTLAGIRRNAPDGALLVVTISVLALIWGVARTILVVRILGRPVGSVGLRR